MKDEWKCKITKGNLLLPSRKQRKILSVVAKNFQMTGHVILFMFLIIGGKEFI